MSNLSRRALLLGTAATALAATSREARADTRLPVTFLSHGSPRLPLDPVRSGDLRAWGKKLPKPRGIVVMTPHFATRTLTLGPMHRGFGMYDMPGFIKKQLPQELDYPSPPSEALGARIEQLVGQGAGAEPVARQERRGFDHTSWMPLLYLYPPADVPVVELSYPYRPEPALLALGRKLAPLRDEGILFVASGQLTHNLASIDLEKTEAPPAWSREFDRWATETLARDDVDAVIDWRHKAPAADLAHPDDGAHFRVLIVALGIAAGSGGPAAATFPVTGYESTMSRRCVQLG
jgi:4,5-DOPA dioxygenase extradiol